MPFFSCPCSALPCPQSPNSSSFFVILLDFVVWFGILMPAPFAQIMNCIWIIFRGCWWRCSDARILLCWFWCNLLDISLNFFGLSGWQQFSGRKKRMLRLCIPRNAFLKPTQKLPQKIREWSLLLFWPSIQNALYTNSSRKSLTVPKSSLLPRLLTIILFNFLTDFD